MPDEINGPVIDLTIHNDGAIAHELAVVKVRRGTTLRQVVDAGVGELDLAPFVLGDPGGINLLGAGEQLRYQRVLQPGNYVYFLPGRGVYRIFRVVDTHQRELPEAERCIQLGDDALAIPALTPGPVRYAITNTGTRPHEVFILGVANPSGIDLTAQFGVWSDQIGAWLDGGQSGPPPIPVHFPGGHQSIEPGQTVVLTLSLHKATTYAFVDPSNDPPNTAIADTGRRHHTASSGECRRTG